MAFRSTNYIVLCLYLELWFGIWTNYYGTLCQNDFGKPVTDPCCENVRVHYKQRTVYEILNLHHDDLKRGVNCFQRVCPSQFPAFYRVMYVGDIRGTSVSFAVCSDGEHVSSDRQTEPKFRGRRLRKRNTKTRKHILKSMKSSANTKRGVYQISDDESFVFRDYITRTRLGSKLLEENDDDSSHQSKTVKNLNFSRNKREADTSRTLFEIPEPRPSIVYTLTGVCFCLRVVSQQQQPPKENENNQPMYPADLVYDYAATKRNASIPRQNPNTSLQESLENISENRLFTTIKRSRHGLNDSFLDNENIINTSSLKQRPMVSAIDFKENGKKRKRRSSLMDAFIKSILEAQEKLQGNSTLSGDSKMQTSTMTELTSQRQSTRSTKNNPIVLGKSNTLPPKDLNMNTQKYAGTTHYNNADDTRTVSTEGRAMDNKTYSDENNDNDDESDTEEFKDRLVVFASFSHDVHFIGSISMAVSIASSCKSNMPLNPVSGESVNQSRSTTPIPIHGQRPTIQVKDLTPSLTTRTSTSLLKSTSTTTEETSTSPLTHPPKEDTRNTNLVEEVSENNGGGEDSESRFDVLLVWQVSAGAAIAVLLVLSLVFIGLLCRIRKRKSKDRSHQSLPTDFSVDSEPSPTTSSSHLQHLDTATTVPESIGIPRTIQAISRNDPTQVVNVGTVYPMHIRLRSLSSAAEAARLRGQEALRMLNNDKGKLESGENVDLPLVPMKTLGLDTFVDDTTDNGYSKAKPQHLKGIPRQNENMRSPKHALTPTLVVSEGSNVREFDLGQFAVYRNDIMLKLRRCGLRTGKHRRKLRSRDYDNEGHDGTESVYSCYAGGETDI